MKYALIENGTVTNVAVIYEGNADEFPGALPIGAAPVQPGDTYANGRFSRDGIALLSPLEQADGTIAELDAAVVELTYQNVLLEMGL